MVPIASNPLVRDVGLTQLPIGSPAAIPGGTRSEAREPATVPRKNGVRTDENAKAASNSRYCQSSLFTFRKANADPLAMIPKAARVNGMDKVEDTAANTEGTGPHTLQNCELCKLQQRAAPKIPFCGDAYVALSLRQADAPHAAAASRLGPGARQKAGTEDRRQFARGH